MWSSAGNISNQKTPIPSSTIRKESTQRELRENRSAIRLPRAIPNKKVARMMAKEYRELPSGNTSIRVHRISLDNATIPLNAKMNKRNRLNAGSGTRSLDSDFFRLRLSVSNGASVAFR